MPHAPPTLDELVEQLRLRGVRVTTARRAVLDQLLAAGDHHLTADELAARVRAEHPTVHLSTIYRTFEALQEAGVIAPARVADQPAAFHLSGDVHHHAVCTVCGRTLSLPADLLDPVVERLVRDHDFAADPQHLTFAGLCGDCRRPDR